MNPKFLLGLGATLVVMFAAYTISWYWMAGQIEKEMNGFLVTAEQEGVHIQPRAMGVRGYPGLYEAWFSGRVSAADVVVEIPLLEANSMFLPGKPLKLEAPEGISLMEPSDAEIWSLDRLFLKTDIPTTFPELTQEDLTAWRAALVQLSVPVMTALAAIALLNESFSARLLVATALVCGGVAVTLVRPVKRV